MLFENHHLTMHGREHPMIERATKEIAREFSLSIIEVDQLLKAEMHQLEQGACIRQFVPLLAIKQVKERARNRRTPPQAT